MKSSEAAAALMVALVSEASSTEMLMRARLDKELGPDVLNRIISANTELARDVLTRALADFAERAKARIRSEYGDPHLH